jgi:hypothetical protein
MTMGYLSTDVTAALQTVVSDNATSEFQVVTLALMGAAKGLTRKAFEVSIEDILNPKTGKAYSVSLPWNIGSKLAQHIDPIVEMEFSDAYDAANAYVRQHRDASIAVGATKWDAWAKVSHQAIPDADIVSAHNAAKDDAAAKREVSKRETEALLAAGRAATTAPVPMIQPEAAQVGPADALAMALAAVAMLDADALATVGAAVAARQTALAEEALAVAA